MTWSDLLGREMQGGGGREQAHCKRRGFLSMPIGQQRAVGEELTGALNMGKHHLGSTYGARKYAISIRDKQTRVQLRGIYF